MLLRFTLHTTAIAVAVLVGTGGIRSADAQGAPTGTTLERGARVRVTATNLPRPIEAHVDAVRNDSVWFSAGTTGYVFAAPVLAVRRVELPDGKGSRVPNTVLGATLGTAAGVALGYQVALMVEKLNPDCADCEYDPLPSELRQWRAEDRRLRWVWATGFGVATGIATGFVGSRLPTRERWRDVSLPVRVAIVPTLDRGAMIDVGMVVR